MTTFLDLLKKLSESPGVSGHEQRVAEIFRDELVGYVDDIEIDSIGNVIATKKSAADNAMKVMVETHLDEPALNVKYIEDDGFLRLDYVGLPLLQALPFERVDVHGKHGPILGQTIEHSKSGCEGH